MLGAALLVAARSTRAQTASSGALTGTLLDGTGAPASGARVQACIVADDVAPAPLAAANTCPLQTTTAHDGHFAFAGMEPGSYIVQSTDGVATARQEIVAGAVADVVLRVSSNASLSAPGAAGSSALPLDAAEWQQQQARSDADARVVTAVSVNADIDADRAPETEARDELRTDEISLRGVGAQQNAETADGLSSAQEFRGGGRTNATPGRSVFAQNAISRFRVEDTVASAAFGGGAGALLLTSTRRSRDDFHGSAFGQLGGSALAATDPFALVQRFSNNTAVSGYEKPHELRLNFGALLTGSVSRRHHLDGLVAIDATTQQRTIVSSPRDPGFYTLTATQAALLATRGVTPSAINAALTYLDSLSGPVERNGNSVRAYARSDFTHHADTISASFAANHATGPAGIASNRSVVARGRASLGTSESTSEDVRGAWTHHTHSLVNTVLVQWTNELESEQPDTPLAAEPAISPGGLAPEVRIGSEFLFGTPSALGRDAFPDEQRLATADTAVWVHGRQIFSWGAEAARVTDRVAAALNREGTFAYDSGSAASGTSNGRAGGLVDWITDATYNVNAYPNGGCPSILAPVHLFCFRSFTQTFGENTVQFPLSLFSAFAQVHWRLRESLTLDAGARFEYTLLPVPQTPNAVLDATFGAQGASSVFPEDRNNIAPRLGLAWSPRKGAWGTVRAGAGGFFGRVPGSTVRAALANTAQPASTLRIRITPSTVTACPQIASQGFGYPCVFPAAPPAAIAQTTSADVFSRRFRLPSVVRAELGWQRTFHGVAVTAGYSGAFAVQLPNTVDINIAPATSAARFQLQGGTGTPGVRDGDTFVVPEYVARLSPAFGPVTLLTSNANATFHALRVRAARTAAGAFACSATYTWSKALDYGPDYGVEPRANSQFDPFAVAYDKGRADADFPHQVAGTLLFRSSFARGPGRLRATLSQWRLSTIASAGSGRPYSYEVFGGRSLSGGAVSINGAGGGVYLPTVGRNTLRLPLRWSADVRLARAFRLTGRTRVEAAASVFNVANHVNPSRVNARAFLAGTAVNGTTPLLFQSAAAVAAEGLPPSSVFGTVTTAGIGLARERRAQLEFRLSW